MMRDIALLMRLDKPIGIYLLFWPVAWAMILNLGQMTWTLFAVFTAGVVLMRSAGCVINDMADRKFDKQVARTKDRPLTAGRLSLTTAVITLLVLLGLAASLLFFLNPLCWMLAGLAVVLTGFYPLSKRFLQCPQLVLGVTFNLGVLMVFAQTQGEISTLALWCYTAAALWTIAYDTLYAIADKPDDLRVGIKSSAIWFGERDFDITCMIYGAMFVNLIAISILLEAPWWGYACWLVPAAMVVYLLVGLYRERIDALAAFKMNHWVGVAVAGVMIAL